MLRLFRNYLCLATVLQLGTAVQAQQNSVSAKPVAKPTAVTPIAPHQPAIVTSKSIKTVTPASVTSKPTNAVPPSTVTSKSTKTIPPSIIPAQSPTKSATTVALPIKPHQATAPTATSSKSDIVPAIAKPGQAAASAVTSKSTVVTIPKSAQLAGTPAKGGANPAKTEPNAPKSAKTEAAQGAPKSAKTEAAQGAPKSAKTQEKVVQVKHSSSPRLGLVPPPPPDTPTIFAGEGMFPGMGAIDFNNPAALAARRKDIASQLASAKKLLADKEQRTKELKDKVIQFQSLYSEGVISRRELETAQKESDSTAAELNDSKTQTMALQNTLSRLDDRAKPKSLASSSKKKVKGKIKAPLKSSVKVADSPTVTAGKTSAVVSAKDTAKDSGSPVVHSSENMDSELSAASSKPPSQADLKH